MMLSSIAELTPAFHAESPSGTCHLHFALSVNVEFLNTVTFKAGESGFPSGKEEDQDRGHVKLLRTLT